MLKYFFFALLLYFAQSRLERRFVSDEEKGKAMIEHYLSSTPIKRYKPLLFSELDSALTSVKNTPEYQSLALDELILLSQSNPFRAENSLEEAELRRRKEALAHRRDSLETAYVPDFIGWKIQHIYTSKDKEKGTVVNKFTFYFSKDMSRLVRVEQVYRNLMVATFEREPDFYGLDF